MYINLRKEIVLIENTSVSFVMKYLGQHFHPDFISNG